MFPAKLNELNLDIKENVSLASFTTFQIGGVCPCLITCKTSDEVSQVVRILREDDILFIFMGGGSNLLVSDDGIDCVVVRYLSPASQIELKGNDLKVGASTLIDDLVCFAAEKGLAGLNYCSGIPGTVGGAVVGNAGAFGKQIGDVLVSAELLDKEGNLKEVVNGDLAFQYRDSTLKTSYDIVLSVTFRLSPANKEQLFDERKEILNLRHIKHPDYKEHPCAGSFFRNIEKTSDAGQRQAAGWFLDKAGAKDLKVGGAGVYKKHANIIINENKATAQDVYSLSRKMAARVKQEFDIDLIREVLCVGHIAGAEEEPASIVW